MANFLQQRRRWAESIPLLVELVGERPNDVGLRVMLMKGYFHTGNGELLSETLKAADAYFHEEGRWYEGTIAALASGCLEAKLYRASTGYYDEAIALRVNRSA